MPALLRASCGILSSSKTLKPLQLFQHSMPTSSLLGHFTASECLLVIGAKVIGLLFSPLGSQSRSEWKSSQSTSTTSTACWACCNIWNFSEHHILWHLTWEQFFSVGIKILGYLTWVALKRSVSSRASQCVFFSISGLSLRGQITYTPLSLETYNIVDVILSTVWTRDFFKHPPPWHPCMRKSHIVWAEVDWKKMLIWNSDLDSLILLNFAGKKFLPPQTKPLLAER